MGSMVFPEPYLSNYFTIIEIQSIIAKNRLMLIIMKRHMWMRWYFQILIPSQKPIIY